MNEPTEVLVGQVGRAHGLRGEVTVRPTTDFAEVRFAAGALLRADQRRLTVVGYRWQQGTLVVTFDGVADRSAAEALRGASLWATAGADELDLGVGEFHDRDLVGLEVRPAGETESIGRITGVLHFPAQDLLQIQTATGERLVPLVSDLVPRIEVGEGFIEVTALPGLLDDQGDQ